MSGTPIGDYHQAEGKAGRMGARLMAIVAEGDRGRALSIATDSGARGCRCAKSEAGVEAGQRHLPATALGNFRVTGQYGMTNGATSSPPPTRGADDLLRPGAGSARAGAARRHRRRPARRSASPCATAAPAPPPTRRRSECLLGVRSRRLADYNIRRSVLEAFRRAGQCRNTFGRQALPMTWDFAESNVLGHSAICWQNAVKYSADNLEALRGGFRCWSAVAPRSATLELH